MQTRQTAAVIEAIVYAAYISGAYHGRQSVILTACAPKLVMNFLRASKYSPDNNTPAPYLLRNCCRQQDSSNGSDNITRFFVSANIRIIIKILAYADKFKAFLLLFHETVNI
jgi:hypothetical protein